jgi:hypothetical protein
MNETILRHYTIYLEQTGYSVREWLIRSGQRQPEFEHVLVGGLATLEEARLAVPLVADFWVPRLESDDPTIVEVWL